MGGHDPAADVALRRAETVLTRLAPDTMSGHERLVAQGRGWLDSLRDLHGYLDAELARRHGIRMPADRPESDRPAGDRERDSRRPPPPAEQPAAPRADEPTGPERRAAEHDRPAPDPGPGPAGPRGPEWLRVDNSAWLREAGVAELTRMWEAALRAGDRDMFAASAAARLGDRLTHVHPAGASAVAGYQAARRRGRGHDAAFQSARQILRRGERPNVVDGEVVDRSRSRSAPGRGDQRRPQTSADPPVRRAGATRRGTAATPAARRRRRPQRRRRRIRPQPLTTAPNSTPGGNPWLTSRLTAATDASAAVDVMAILAAQQDQIDDLAGAVEALSRTVEQLLVAVRER